MMEKEQSGMNREAHEADRRQEEEDEPQPYDVDGCLKNAVSDP
jgi:hypothetical protein